MHRFQSRSHDQSRWWMAIHCALAVVLLAGCLPQNSTAQPTPPAPTSAAESHLILPTKGTRATPRSDQPTPAASTPAVSPAAGTYAVLFDASHGETAGNADWVISTSQPDPLRQDANPRRESDWTGALSAWGVALQQTGRYQLMTLPRSGRISYGDSANQLDLAKFNVFVVPEPNVRFSATEKTAIMRFVQAGGGLFMIADHDRSDRNNDGSDSLAIWNDLMSDNSVQGGDPFGFSFDKLQIGSDNPRNMPDAARSSPVIHGPFGDVTGSIIRDGTTATIDPTANRSVQPLLFRSRADTSGTTGVFFLTSSFGSGRVAAWGDSSAVDDGTGAANETLFDGWNDAGGSDAILALNATEWLAQSGTAPVAAASTPAPAPPSAAGATLIQNGDFERGSSGWSAPLISDAQAHSGTQAADLCGYNDCSESLAQTIQLPAGAKSLSLSYYTFITTEEADRAFDFLNVELRDANGKRLQQIQRLSNTDPTGRWQQNTFTLNNYASQTVQLVFSASSGKLKPTAFFIDDVVLQ